jgi:CRISPR-associated protein Cas1
VDIAQNTLYITTPGTWISRDHLTLLIETPVYPPELPPEERTRDRATDWRKLPIPIHLLESICLFGPCSISPAALDLCWQNGVTVNFLTDHGHLQARLAGVPDTSVTLRRAQFRAADDPAKCALISRNIIAGKLQNARNSLLRAARESEISNLKSEISAAANAIARQIHKLSQLQIPHPKSEISNSKSHSASNTQMHGINPSTGPDDSGRRDEPNPFPHLKSEISNPKSEITNLKSEISNPKSLMDTLRGLEGIGTAIYFSVFNGLLKQQRDVFAFKTRSHRPPRDRINCLLSFIYALLRHDCIAALTAVGLDPFVGFLHAERPNRPALALDLMEEFRPWLADRLAITLINRQQIGTDDFHAREGGAVELTDTARKRVITAWQQRKQEPISHTLLGKEFRIGQLPFLQARILARHLRGDIPGYVPFIPK